MLHNEGGHNMSNEVIEVTRLHEERGRERSREGLLKIKEVTKLTL